MICLVTDRARFDVLSSVRAAARAGVDLVQVRERDMADRALLSLVHDVLAAVAGTGTRVLVNERTDIALAAGAHGVHLRGDSVRAARVREIVPQGFFVGRSVHTVDEAVEADRERVVDYLVFGTVFPSESKPAGHGVAGLSGLARVCSAVRTPVLAIGGITPERAADVARAGASGVAAIGLFSGTDIARTVREIKRAFDTPYRVV